MKTQRRSTLSIVLSVLLTPGSTFVPASAAPTDTVTASLKSEGGLNVTTFETMQGKVHVYLPSDLAAGDTITGTVSVEPKQGATAKDESDLEGYVAEVGVGDNRSSSAGKILMLAIPAAGATTALITLRGSDKNEVAHQAVAVPAAPPRTDCPPSSPMRRVKQLSEGEVAPIMRVSLPKIGQVGKPIEVPVTFAADTINVTRLRIGDVEAPLLAASPRKAIWLSPAAPVGATSISITHGDYIAEGQFRNVSVKLSAPRVHLEKGETTIISCTVDGLDGLERPLPLLLQDKTPGVVVMEGGTEQLLLIHPSDVLTGGLYTLSRRVQSQTSGAFGIHAEIPFAANAVLSPVLLATMSANCTDCYAECGQNDQKCTVGTKQNSGQPEKELTYTLTNGDEWTRWAQHKEECKSWTCREYLIFACCKYTYWDKVDADRYWKVAHKTAGGTLSAPEDPSPKTRWTSGKNGKNCNCDDILEAFHEGSLLGDTPEKHGDWFKAKLEQFCPDCTDEKEKKKHFKDCGFAPADEEKLSKMTALDWFQWFSEFHNPLGHH